MSGTSLQTESSCVAGQDLKESLLLLDGWVARTKDLRDGGRQISELAFAGDFTDLHAFTLKRLDHNIATITPCRVAVAPHERIRETLGSHPHLARVYWLMTNIDAAIHREWTVSLGRRSAQSRMAHLFCETLERLKVVGLADDDSYDFPLTQQEFGECLGLTSVHVNRTLQSLAAARPDPGREPPGDDPRPAGTEGARRIRSRLSLPGEASPLTGLALCYW